ncbi:hypothetical protein SDC9_195441 [bioreactor metagenome]|uniref:Uncharacterized protein n=1 Tax=bioreactor metagenome TaxID=1076179 RepID=A0A645I922_9ZZZZ
MISAAATDDENISFNQFFRKVNGIPVLRAVAEGGAACKRHDPFYLSCLDYIHERIQLTPQSAKHRFGRKACNRFLNSLRYAAFDDSLPAHKILNRQFDEPVRHLLGLLGGVWH